MSSPRQRLVGDANAERNRERRKLAKIANDRVLVADRVRRSRRTDEQKPRAEGDAHPEHRLRDADLVVVQRPGQAFEIAQRLQTCRTQSARGERFGGRALVFGVTRDVGGGEHYLAEIAVADRREPAGKGTSERRRIYREM